MNERQRTLIEILQERMHDILEMMEKDPHYAPPKWTYQNIWCTLEAILTLTSSSCEDDVQSLQSETGSSLS